MVITGYYDTKGDFFPYAEGPVPVVLLGDTLRDPDTGFLEAIKDQYGDWVNPRMLQLGIKSKMQVEDRPHD